MLSTQSLCPADPVQVVCTLPDSCEEGRVARRVAQLARRLLQDAVSLQVVVCLVGAGGEAGYAFCGVLLVQAATDL